MHKGWFLLILIPIYILTRAPIFDEYSIEIKNDPLVIYRNVESLESQKNTENIELKYTENEIILMTKTLYGECRGLSDKEIELVAWTICNRVDSGNWGNSVEDVILAENQFHGYSENYPVDEKLYVIAEKVLKEWSQEKDALILEPYSKTSNYLFFYGDGEHNYFREEF